MLRNQALESRPSLNLIPSSRRKHPLQQWLTGNVVHRQSFPWLGFREFSLMRICTDGDDVCPFYETTFMYELKQGRPSILPCSAYVRPHSVVTEILDRTDAKPCCLPRTWYREIQFCTPNLCSIRCRSVCTTHTPSYHSCNFRRHSIVIQMIDLRE